MEYSLFQRRGHPHWFVEWYERGHRREQCLHTEDEHSADDLARSLVAGGDAQAHCAATAGEEAYAVAHALQDLLSRGCSDNAAGTVRCYTQRAGQLLRILGEQPLASLRLDDVQAFVNTRLAEDAAPETVRKELCVLRRALDLAHKRGIPGPAPEAAMPRFRARYVPRKTWLSQRQFAELLAALPEDRALFVLVAVYTGARLSELVRLSWPDVDFDADHIHIRGTKTQQSDRFVPLHPRLRDVLRGRRALRGPVLPAWLNIRRDLALACQKAGVPVVTPNDLRRTFASWLVQAGETSYVVAQLLGHSSSTMVERVYGRLAGHTLREAISKLPEHTEE